jgi:putative transposase
LFLKKTKGSWMTHSQRPHSCGAIHYVVLAGSEGRPLFTDDDDRERMSCLVERFASACRACVHAYCWSITEARMVIEATDVPLNSLIHRIATQYARSLNRKCGESGPVFRHGHYLTVPLQGKFRLLEVVRHVHLTPVECGLTDNAAKYKWSSHAAYLGQEQSSWLTTGAVLELLEADCGRRRNAYRLYMAGSPRGEWSRPPRTAATSDRCADSRFITWLKRESAGGGVRARLDEIIGAVCDSLKLSPTQLRLRSHNRRLTLARGLITWYATRARIASLSDVARRFDRDPSTVYTAVTRYRKRYPELFKGSLEELLKARQTSHVSKDQVV